MAVVGSKQDHMEGAMSRKSCPNTKSPAIPKEDQEDQEKVVEY